MRMVLGLFSAPSRTLVATNQAQATVRWEAGGPNQEKATVVGGALSPNTVPRVHFGTLKIDKIDAPIDTKIDAEKVSKQIVK